jgi:ribonucleoside-diphosphate reductase alpha chain
VWNPNGTDKVITFYVEVPKDALIKTEVSAVKLLEHVKLTQENWVMECPKP